MRSSVSVWLWVYSLSSGLGFHFSDRLWDWSWKRRQVRLRTLCWKLRREPQCRIYCTRYMHTHLIHLPTKGHFYISEKENQIHPNTLNLNLVDFLDPVCCWLYGNTHLPTVLQFILFHALNNLATWFKFSLSLFLSPPSSNSQFQVTNPDITGFRLSGEGVDDLKISPDGWLYLDKPLDWSKDDHYILMVKWVSPS